MLSPVSGFFAPRYDAASAANGNGFADALQNMPAKDRGMANPAAPARVSPALENTIGTIGLNPNPASYSSSSGSGNDRQIGNPVANMADAPVYAPLDQGARMNVLNAAAGDRGGWVGRPDGFADEYRRKPPSPQGDAPQNISRADSRVGPS